MGRMSKAQFTCAVVPQYLEDQSNPVRHEYAFAYTVTIVNSGDVPAQLIGRHWIITDATGRTEEIFNIPHLDQKWRAFGWEVISTDGHDVDKIIAAIDQAKTVKGKPTLIILDTIKGKGVSFAENTPAYHHGTFDDARYAQAMAELDAQKAMI